MRRDDRFIVHSRSKTKSFSVTNTHLPSWLQKQTPISRHGFRNKHPSPVMASETNTHLPPWLQKQTPISRLGFRNKHSSPVMASYKKRCQLIFRGLVINALRYKSLPLLKANYPTSKYVQEQVIARRKLQTLYNDDFAGSLTFQPLKIDQINIYLKTQISNLRMFKYFYLMGKISF